MTFDFREIVSAVRRVSNSKTQTFAWETEIDVNDEYNLPFSLLSSYACYYYEPIGSFPKLDPYHWIGKVEPFTGIHLIQRRDGLKICGDSKISKKILKIITESIGITDQDPINLSTENFVLEKLSNELYSGIKIPKQAHDPLGMMAAAILSIHTPVSNSRNWFLFLKSNFERISEIGDLSPRELMDDSARSTGISMGYRARYIIEIVNQLRERNSDPDKVLQNMLNKEIGQARRQLIAIKYVGPKVADCILLNVLGDRSVAPIDVNVKRVGKRLSLIPKNLSMPRTDFCKEYHCLDGKEKVCPLIKEYNKRSYSPTEINGCMRGYFTQKFSSPALVQAIMFLFGVEYCRARNPRCSECVFREGCSGPQTIVKPRKRKRRTVYLSKKRSQKPKQTWTKSKALGKKAESEKYLENYFNLPIFESFGDKIGQIRNTTKFLLKGCRNAKIRTKTDIVATCFLVACRYAGLPLALHEISQEIGVLKSDIFRAMRRLTEDLGLKVPSVKPHSYITIFSKRLDLQREIEQEAEKLVDALSSDKIGKIPNGIAIAAIFIALNKSHIYIPKRQLCEIAGISEVTLRNLVKIFMSKKASKSLSVNE